jgi:hypothetical protein
MSAASTMVRVVLIVMCVLLAHMRPDAGARDPSDEGIAALARQRSAAKANTKVQWTMALPGEHAFAL